MKKRIQIRHVAAGIVLLWLVSVAAICQAQSSSPERGEVSLRLNNLRDYYGQIGTHSGDLMQYYSATGPFSFELVALKHLHNHTFVRVGAGLGYFPGRGSLRRIPSLGTIGQTEHIEAVSLSSEIGYGYEFNTEPSPILRRFQLRLGVNLALNYGARQFYRRLHVTTNGQEFLHLSSNGGNMLRASLFFQAGFRISKKVTLGMELRFGPKLIFGKSTFEHLHVQNFNAGGHEMQEFSITKRGFNYTFQNPLGRPIFSLGITF